MRKTILAGIRWMALPTVLSALLNVLKILLLVPILAKTDFGLFAISSIFVGLGLQLQEGGINASLVQKGESQPRVLGTIFSFNLLMGLGLFLVNAMLALFWAYFYNIPELWVIGGLHGLLFIIYALGAPLKSLLQRDLQFARWSIVETIGLVIGIGSTLLLAYRGYGIYALIWGMLLQYTFTTIYLLVISPPIRLYFDWSAIRPHLRFTKDHLLERLSTHFIFQLDTILIGRFLGTEALGVYDIFKRILMRPSDMLTSTVERVAFPVLSRLIVQPQAVKITFLQLLSLLGTLQFPAYILAIIVAPGLVPLFFGESWLLYIAAFQGICLMVLLQIIVNPLDSLLLAMERIRWWWYVSLIIGPIFIIAIWWGARGGLLTTIYALNIVYGLLLIGSYGLLIRPQLQLQWTDFYFFIRPLILSLLCGILCWPLRTYIMGVIVLFLSLYLLLSWIFNKNGLLLLFRANSWAEPQPSAS